MIRVIVQPKDLEMDKILEMDKTKNVEGRPQKEVSLEARYDSRIAAERKTQVTLHRMHKDFLNSINAYALVLVLLATLTFIGFLQPPAGFQGTDQRYMLSSTSMTFFIIFNSSSFYLAVADLLLCVCSSLSPLTSIDNPKLGPGPAPAPPVGGHKTLQSELVATSELSQFVASTLFKLICVNVIFALSLVCCVAAFTAAGFVVTKMDNERVPVIVTSVAGVSFFSIFMVWLLRDTGRFVSRAISDKSLSRSLQNRAGLSQIQFRYLSAAADSGTH